MCDLGIVPTPQVNDSDAEIEKCRLKILEDLSLVENMEEIVVTGKEKATHMQTRSLRGSNYRGVSKNGPKWQVMVNKKGLKKYLGAIVSED